jgi:hypothetical protein
MEKKQKLKKVIKEWSKGDEKWKFNRTAASDSATFERTSDISKRHNRQKHTTTQTPMPILPTWKAL